MMKYLIAVLISFQAVAQNLSGLAIPAELKEKAHAVVRNHETEFYVKDSEEAVMKIKGVVTILDEKGSGHASLIIPYNKFTKVSSIEARIYDGNGKQIKKLKREDIESFSTSSGQNSIDDSYVKIASLAYSNYPYTIEYAYQYTSKNMMFYPKWEAILDNEEFTAVEKSSFKVSMPGNLLLRYKEQNMPVKALVEKTDDRVNYSWTVSNLKAIEKEQFSPDYSGTMPTVYTGPTDFKVENYTGNLTTWNDLGKFYGSLNVGRDEIPAVLADKIKELVRNETEVVGKVRKIYEYLQSNTRYVSIQLGLGGWQSMKASDVAAKGYGDCKALTNFTKGLLKVAGVKSYEALVKAGDDEAGIQADFPSFQFNHVILCVPVPNDTLWLECTSQNNPFGYLGSFTGDRNVVLITENGGRLIRTPAYRYNDNRLDRKAIVELKENGEATAVVETIYTGLQQEIFADVMNSLNNESQKKWLYKNLNLPSVEITDFKLNERKGRIPAIKEKLSLSLRNVSAKSGTRIFVTPNLLNPSGIVPLPDAARKADLLLEANYLDTDSITFKLPEGYAIEYLPEPLKIENKFGKYRMSAQFKDNTISYFREVSMFKGRHAPAAYNEWVDFRKKIVKADKNQIVLIRKQ